MCARVGRECAYSHTLGASILGFAPRIVPLGWPGLTDERRRNLAIQSLVAKRHHERYIENKERGWRRADSEGRLNGGTLFRERQNSMRTVYSSLSLRGGDRAGERTLSSPQTALPQVERLKWALFEPFDFSRVLLPFRRS